MSSMKVCEVFRFLVKIKSNQNFTKMLSSSLKNICIVTFYMLSVLWWGLVIPCTSQHGKSGWLNS